MKMEETNRWKEKIQNTERNKKKKICIKESTVNGGEVV
jgi:hypothetical protein